MRFIKNFCFYSLILLLNCSAAFAQVEGRSPGYFLPSPKGWVTEKIEFPLGFAPEIKFSGVEDIRFTKGWSDQKSAEFFSYLFIWYVNENPALTEQKLRENMQMYFDGLTKTVAKGKDIPEKDLTPAAATFTKDKNTFKGQIRIFDAFFTTRTLTLNALAEAKHCKKQNKHVLIFQFSPQNHSHQVWKDLKTVVRDFRCHI